MADLASRLADIVGEDHLLTDPALLATYQTDWTRRFSGVARAVVRPADTAQVAACVVACVDAGQPMLIRGGGTGLVNASVPSNGEVVISLERLRDLEPVDEITGQVTVGAGVTLAALQAHTRPAGWDFGVDFAARDSCTLGGMVSTNAGGERVLRWGTTRAQVAGVEAVLPTGEVISKLAGLPKDNTGYDLAGLITGAEGTLGIITKLRLRLVPLLAARTVALLALPSTEAAVSVTRRLRDRLSTMEAAEIFYPEGLALVREHTAASAPFADDHSAYLLVECASHQDPSDELLAALEDSAEIEDAVIASDTPGRHALWRYREAHTESISAAGIPVKLDVAVPLPAFAEAVAALPGVVADACPTARLILFGHVAEGNLHVNILDALDGDEKVTDAVLQLIASYQGSISAEHGVGRAKRAWLHLSRSSTEITAMRAIKAALDPQGLLNPGILL